LYNFSKSFQPIVLLNTLDKLIEKVIGNRLQFQSILNNFIYPSQLSGLKQRSIVDMGVVLMYFICSEWVKQKMTSSLVFDIAQFFPSLNHHLLSLIFKKVGFDPKVKRFFSNYLISRKTRYFWNNFSSPFSMSMWE